MKLLFTCLALLAACMAQPADAQTVQQLKLSWVLPTTVCETVGTVTTCDKPMTLATDALTAIEIYINTVPIQDTSSMQPTAVLLGTPPPIANVASYTAKVGDTLYIRLKARNGDPVKPLSTFSPQITYLVKASGPRPPGPPSSVNVELIIQATPSVNVELIPPTP